MNSFNQKEQQFESETIQSFVSSIFFKIYQVFVSKELHQIFGCTKL